jgi:5-methylcytosine-specific restriction protein A
MESLMNDTNDTLSCALCGRLFAKKQLTKHHCLPREKGGTHEDVALICSQCHGMIHCTYTNGTLAVLYPTIEQLRQAPELAPYLRWVRKQPSSRRKRNASRRRKL